MPNRRVLLVDDDAIVLRALRRSLARRVGEVAAAASAREALEQLQAGFAPDAVVLDGTLVEVEAVLEAVGDTAPVVIVSGVGAGHLSKAQPKLASLPHIQKPFEVGDLVESIERQLAH